MPTNYLILQDLPSTLQELTGPLAASALYDAGGSEFNVRHPDYGATYDGTGQMTNFGAVCQAAIDDASAAGGGKVVIPAGTYLLGSSKVYVKSNVTLEGLPGSLVKNDGGAFRNGTYLTIAAYGADHDITIRGLTIEDTSLIPGSAPSTSPGIFEFKFTERLRVERNRMYQTGTNPYLYGIHTYSTIRDSWIQNNHHTLAGDLIYLEYGGDNIDISHNTVRGRRDMGGVALVPNGISLWGGGTNIRVAFNDVRGIGDEGISVQACSHVAVIGNYVNDCESACIDVRGTNTNVTVAGNVVGYSTQGQGGIRVMGLTALGIPVGVDVVGNTVDATPNGSAGAGIRIDGAEDVVVDANTVYSSSGTGTGIVIHSTQTTARNVNVTNNTARYLTYGIEVQSCVGCSLDNNVAYNCAGPGIRTYNAAPVRLDIMNNRCSRNGRTVAFSSGIEVNVGDRVTIRGNRCWDDQGTPTQAFAILVNSAVTNAQILDNDVSQGGLSIAAYNHANAPVLVRDNRGYVTRAKNSVTVAAGTASLSVSHGMTRDFESVNNVRLTPRTSLGGLDYWVTDPTAGDGAFTINLSANAPAGGISFSYEVWSDRMNAY